MGYEDCPIVSIDQIRRYRMVKLKRETIAKRNVRIDDLMGRLLSCNQNVACINNILKCYGSSDFTLEEIGAILGITRERVRQIEASALKKLKNPKIGRVLREYFVI